MYNETYISKGRIIEINNVEFRRNYVCQGIDKSRQIQWDNKNRGSNGSYLEISEYMGREIEIKIYVYDKQFDRPCRKFYIRDFILRVNNSKKVTREIFEELLENIGKKVNVIIYEDGTVGFNPCELYV